MASLGENRETTKRSGAMTESPNSSKPVMSDKTDYVSCTSTSSDREGTVLMAQKDENMLPIKDTSGEAMRSLPARITELFSLMRSICEEEHDIHCGQRDCKAHKEQVSTTTSAASRFTSSQVPRGEISTNISLLSQQPQTSGLSVSPIKEFPLLKQSSSRRKRQQQKTSRRYNEGPKHDSLSRDYNPDFDDVPIEEALARPRLGNPVVQTERQIAERERVRAKIAEEYRLEDLQKVRELQQEWAAEDKRNVRSFREDAKDEKQSKWGLKMTQKMVSM